jgi:hypothetical protein
METAMAKRPRGRPPGTTAWTVDNPPDHIAQFVNFYVHERPSGCWTERQVAEATGWSVFTVRKRLRDERVLVLLESALRKSNGGPTKVQAVLDMLHQRAVVLEDVKAAHLYLQAVDRLAPRRVEVTHTDASGLSNEQLASELTRALALLRDHNPGYIEDAEVVDDDEVETLPMRELSA